MNVVLTLLIVLATVVGVVVATFYWRPLKWPAYAFAAWVCVLLIAWPLSATGHLWRHIRVGWYITFALLSAVVVVIFFGFALSLLAPRCSCARSMASLIRLLELDAGADCQP